MIRIDLADGSATNFGALPQLPLGGAAGQAEVVLEGDPLDFPASAAIEGTGTEGALYITNAAFLSGAAGKPGLLRVGFQKGQ